MRRLLVRPLPRWEALTTPDRTRVPLSRKGKSTKYEHEPQETGNHIETEPTNAHATNLQLGLRSPNERIGLRRLPLLAHGAHLAHRLDEVPTERVGRSLGARDLGLDPKLDHLVAGEVCAARSVASLNEREEHDSQLIPYPFGYTAPKPVPWKRSPALSPLVERTHS